MRYKACPGHERGSCSSGRWHRGRRGDSGGSWGSRSSGAGSRGLRNKHCLLFHLQPPRCQSRCLGRAQKRSTTQTWGVAWADGAARVALCSLRDSPSSVRIFLALVRQRGGTESVEWGSISWGTRINPKYPLRTATAHPSLHRHHPSVCASSKSPHQERQSRQPTSLRPLQPRAHSPSGCSPVATPRRQTPQKPPENPFCRQLERHWRARPPKDRSRRAPARTGPLSRGLRRVQRSRRLDRRFSRFIYPIERAAGALGGGGGRGAPVTICGPWDSRTERRTAAARPADAGGDTALMRTA